MNQVLKYPGGKWRIASWITSFIPSHKVYLEPFCGSAAVFFAKAPVTQEFINDIDGNVINFFRVCREHPDELAELLYFTPYSREEFSAIEEPHTGSSIILSDNPIENARRFAIRCFMSFGSKLGERSGWRYCKTSRGSTPSRAWANLPYVIYEVAERLKNAQIECSQALELIKRFNTDEILIYADPPYLLKTRKQNKLYRCEMNGEDEHIALLNALLSHKGPVIISGYDSELYNNMLSGWVTAEKRTQDNTGSMRTEKLWMNYPMPIGAELD